VCATPPAPEDGCLSTGLTETPVRKVYKDPVGNGVAGIETLTQARAIDASAAAPAVTLPTVATCADNYSPAPGRPARIRIRGRRRPAR
jgi:hypothetical protein